MKETDREGRKRGERVQNGWVKEPSEQKQSGQNKGPGETTYRLNFAEVSCSWLFDASLCCKTKVFLQQIVFRPCVVIRTRFEHKLLSRLIIVPVDSETVKASQTSLEVDAF